MKDYFNTSRLLTLGALNHIVYCMFLVNIRLVDSNAIVKKVIDYICCIHHRCKNKVYSFSEDRLDEKISFLVYSTVYPQQIVIILKVNFDGFSSLTEVFAIHLKFG